MGAPNLTCTVRPLPPYLSSTYINSFLGPISTKSVLDLFLEIGLAPFSPWILISPITVNRRLPTEAV